MLCLMRERKSAILDDERMSKFNGKCSDSVIFMIRCSQGLY